MKKSHAGIWSSFAMLFSAAVYSAILFLVKSAWDISAWILYGFTMTAFVLAAVQLATTTRNSSSTVMDTTLGLFMAAYWGLQLLFGGIILMCFSGLSMMPVLIGEILLLAAYLLISFVMYAAQSHSAAQDQNNQNAVRKFRLQESEILSLAEQQRNAEYQDALKALAEDIHFSELSSDPGVNDVDVKIIRNIIVLEEQLKARNGDVNNTIEIIRQLIKEYNRTAMILKK